MRLAMLNSLALVALAGPVAAQSGPVESHYLAEFLRRLVAPAQEGRPFDLSGLERGETLLEATTHFAPDGRFVATISPKGDGVQVFSAVSADENATPSPRHGGQVLVVMTKAEIDAMIAAFLQWRSSTEGVAATTRCAEWVAPGSAPHILLQLAALLQHADGRPMVLEVHVVHTISCFGREHEAGLAGQPCADHRRRVALLGCAYGRARDDLYRCH